jgi:hypothetical protein
MADIKISALPAATTPLAGTEVLPIVQSGVTSKVSISNLTAGRSVSASALVVSGNATVGGTLGVTGVTTLGALGVTGVATLGAGAILGTPASGVLTNCTGINYDGYKNRIINGSMANDQRNASAAQTFTAAAALAYSVDRWYGYCTGANVTGQQVAGSTTPTNTQFRYRFTGAASVTAVGFGQRIEQKNSYDLAGSTATLSADLAISATLTTVTWTASYATTTADTFGSLASPTVTQIATGTFTVSATVTNFNAQITVPAAATTGIQIVFTVGALTAGLTWTIGNVQLEKGATATSFDYRSIGTELTLCQRYYEKTFDQTLKPAQNTSNFANAIAAGSNGGTASSGVWSTSWSFAAVKRVAPTVVTYSPSAANANWYAPAGPDSSVTYTGTAGTGGIQATHSSAPTAGARMYYVHATADSEL